MNTDFDFARRLVTVSANLDRAIDCAYVAETALSEELLDASDEFTLGMQRNLHAMRAAIAYLYILSNDLEGIVREFREDRVEDELTEGEWYDCGKEAQPEP